VAPVAVDNAMRRLIAVKFKIICTFSYNSGIGQMGIDRKTQGCLEYLYSSILPYPLSIIHHRNSLLEKAEKWLC
jgi:hypothetical protein